MDKKPTIEQFNQILQAIAKDLLATVQKEMQNKVWKDAFLDVRGPKVGNMQLEKFRIVLQDGELKTLKESMEVGGLLIDAWDIKDEVFPDKFYGIKFTIYPDGKCETEFNYDPDCMDDPTFFDS